MKDMKNDSGIRKTFAKFNIQSIISVCTDDIVSCNSYGYGFSAVSVVLNWQSDKSAVANTEMTVESTIDQIEFITAGIFGRFRDAANYNIVQEYDISESGIYQAVQYAV